MATIEKEQQKIQEMLNELWRQLKPRDGLLHSIVPSMGVLKTHYLDVLLTAMQQADYEIVDVKWSVHPPQVYPLILYR